MPHYLHRAHIIVLYSQVTADHGVIEANSHGEGTDATLRYHRSIPSRTDDVSRTQDVYF